MPGTPPVFSCSFSWWKDSPSGLDLLHGIQGENKGVAHLIGDVEVFALAGQYLAKIQVLHCQGLALLIHHW